MHAVDKLCYAAFHQFAQASLVHGELELVLPDGTVQHYGGAGDTLPAVPAAPTWMGMPPKKSKMTVRNMDMFFKIITRHDTGLGEAYMAGDFVTDDLGAFMAVMTANARHMQAQRGILGALNFFGTQVLYLAHLTRTNTVKGSRKNIHAHYDAGNAMYRLFLDPSLTYSSGIHEEGGSLHDAQMRKLDALLDAAGVQGGSRVLEIGCGWGSAAIRAVQRHGCRWTGAAALFAPGVLHARDGPLLTCSNMHTTATSLVCS